MRRGVVQGGGFRHRVRFYFPAESAVGEPTLSHFEAQVLPMIIEAFAEDYDGQLSEAAGLPVRFVVVVKPPLFVKPICAYAVLSAPDTVELVDLVVDTEYELFTGES